jgi:hypothetical protein
MSMSLFGKKSLNPTNQPHPIATCVTTSPSSPTAPNGGELTIVPVAGEPEAFTMIAGEMQESSSTAKGGTRLVMMVGTMMHGQVPANGTSHYAVNEGQRPTLMILIEVKGTATEKTVK